MRRMPIQAADTPQQPGFLPAGQAADFMMDRNGKILRLTDAEVEVEFVVNTNGTVWGNSTSRYKDMMARRRQAKEDPDHFWKQEK